MPVPEAQLTWYLFQKPRLASVQRHLLPSLPSPFPITWGMAGGTYLGVHPPLQMRPSKAMALTHLPLSPSPSRSSWCWQRVNVTVLS